MGEPETLTMTASSASYVGKDANEVKTELENLGFLDVKTIEVETTDSKNKKGMVANVLADGNAFENGTQLKDNVEIVISVWRVPSKYEKAYIRDMSNYDLYYMFDTDNKTVVFFGTESDYIDKGTYTGDFSTGIKIIWDHGEWTEKFTHKSGNTAILIDGNGWDWEYKVCDVDRAQAVLDKIQ